MTVRELQAKLTELVAAEDVDVDGLVLMPDYLEVQQLYATVSGNLIISDRDHGRSERQV